MYGKTKYDSQFLSSCKIWIPTSTSMPKKFNFFFQRNELYVEEDYEFLPTFKKQVYPGKNFHNKNSVFEKNILFPTKGTKYMWKKTINFCHFSKNVSRQVNPCQKTQVFEIRYSFFHQRNEMYLKEDYHFLSPFKNCIPTSTSVPKAFSV